MKRKIYIVFFALIVVFQQEIALGQKINALKIGEEIPENIISKSAELQSGREKLIILDFWSTWCTPCVESIPKMEDLQKYFGNRLKVILINERRTGDTQQIIKTFFEKRLSRTGKKPPELPLVNNDTTFGQLFPHLVKPHCVWIDEHGRVKAMTSAIEVNRENIQTILDGKEIKLRIKKNDRGWITDLRKQELFDFDGKEAQSYLYRRSEKVKSFISGYLDGEGGSAASSSDTAKSASGVILFNETLYALIQRAYNEEIKSIPERRQIWNVTNPLKYKPFYIDSNVYKYSYTYGIRLSPALDDTKFGIMQEDLKKAFNISVKTEKRKMKCWIISASNLVEKSISKGAPLEVEIEDNLLKKYFRNMPISWVVGLFDMLDKPLIDETNLKKNLDMNLPYNLKDKNAMMKTLREAGFVLKVEEREVEVAVITDK